VTPHSGRSGTDFVIDCSFTSKNGTGTGMIRIEIVSATQDFLLEAKKPGTYVEKIDLKTLDLGCNSANGKSCSFLTNSTIKLRIFSQQEDVKHGHLVPTISPPRSAMENVDHIIHILLSMTLARAVL
jgi:hypothetical protein